MRPARRSMCSGPVNSTGTSWQQHSSRRARRRFGLYLARSRCSSRLRLLASVAQMLLPVASLKHRADKRVRSFAAYLLLLGRAEGRDLVHYCRCRSMPRAIALVLRLLPLIGRVSFCLPLNLNALGRLSLCPDLTQVPPQHRFFGLGLPCATDLLRSQNLSTVLFSWRPRSL